jgi:hypothetical protein
MKHVHRKADSLDRIEILMALEEQHPELGTVFETLWDLDPDFDETAVVPLRPYICTPVEATAVRGGIATHVTVFARHGDRVLALDHDCKQLAVGTATAERSVTDVRHYRTLELAVRIFLSETSAVMASNKSLERTREG